MPDRVDKVKLFWVKDRVPFGRPVDHSKFYNARKWRNTAKAHKEKNPVCAECKREGRTGPADVTDHIRGLQFLLENKINPYQDKELQSMCHHHHNKKSGREAHGKRKSK